MKHNTEFITLIKANEGLIYKMVRVYTNSKEDEKDLYQEIVYQLWKSFGAFRNESKASTWMYRIALNTSITHLHKEKRKGNQISVNEEILCYATTTDDGDEEQIQLLYDHIRKLSRIEKGIILLYLEGKNYEEIATITGFSTTNVGTRLGRIKQKIKSQIIK